MSKEPFDKWFADTFLQLKIQFEETNESTH